MAALKLASGSHPRSAGHSPSVDRPQFEEDREALPRDPERDDKLLGGVVGLATFGDLEAHPNAAGLLGDPARKELGPAQATGSAITPSSQKRSSPEDTPSERSTGVNVFEVMSNHGRNPST